MDSDQGNGVMYSNTFRTKEIFRIYLHSISVTWPLVPKFAGSNPAEAVGFFGRKKILSTPSFGREVKPSVPCRALRYVKEPKSDVAVATFGKILSATSRP
jgi:hypothetical protein